MTQAIDIQSRKIRMIIIPNPIKLGTHIQTAPKHAADDIIPAGSAVRL